MRIAGLCAAVGYCDDKIGITLQLGSGFTESIASAAKSYQLQTPSFE
jgi:hypothetical protein